MRIGDFPVGHELFGRLTPCPVCGPKQAPGAFGLMAGDESLTWAAIRPMPCKGSYQGVKFSTTTDKLALRLRDWIGTKPGTFAYLYGSYGQAKSLILKVAVAEALRSNRQAQYVVMSDLLDSIRDAFDSADPRESALSRFNRWRNVEFLAVDELDKAKLTDWAAERMFSLFDYRYESALHGSGVTLLAGNRKPEEIDGALASRARDGRSLYIELIGNDARPSMEWTE